MEISNFRARARMQRLSNTYIELLELMRKFVFGIALTSIDSYIINLVQYTSGKYWKRASFQKIALMKELFNRYI